MNLKYNEELRLLLKICIMLLKANRRTISAKELDSISETHFNANRVSGRLSLLDKTLGLKEPLAIGTCSIKNNLEFNSVELKYPLWVYEEMLEEILHEKEAVEVRDSNMIVPAALSYKDCQAFLHITEEKFRYIGKMINGKKISGIGKHAIKLDDDFHNYLPENMFLRSGMKTAGCDGCEIALQIIKKYGDLNDSHLKYITHGIEIEEEKEENPSSSSLEVEEYIPPKELLEGDFRDLKIRDKVIWGIGPKAITLVDGVGYNEEYYYPRYSIGEKKFFNYKQKPAESKELAEEILDKYYYRE